MSPNELLLSLELGFIYAIVGMGIYLTFRTIDFPDLTCDGSFVLGAVSCAVLIKNGYNPWVALAASFIAGSLAGGVTGFLHIRFKITNLLCGILVAFMLYSINLKILGGSPNISLLNKVTIFTSTSSLGVLSAIVFLCVLLLSYLLTTDFGLSLRCIGQNKRLALNGGLKVGALTITGLMLSNGIIGLAGALFTQHQGFADVSQGVGTIIVGLAAVMIGERLFFSKSPWFGILSCLVGSILYRLFIGIALHSDWLGLKTQDLNLITGILVIGVMLLPTRGKKHA
jgi:putative ABC transport system permease protein